MGSVNTNFGVNDTLKITAGSIQTRAAIGDDYVVNVKGTNYGGAVTLGGAGNYNFIQKGKVLTVAALNYVVNSTDGVKVTGTGGADVITNSGERVTIEAKGGNDTIYGSDEFGELYSFNYNSGDNVIANFGVNDTLKSTSGTISTSLDGEDAVVTITRDNKQSTVRLKNTNTYSFKTVKSNLTVEHVSTKDNDRDNEKVSGSDQAEEIYNTGDGVTIQGGGGNDTITGSDEYGEVILFDALGGYDLITNWGENDTLKITSGVIQSTLVSGNDLIVNVKDPNYAGAITLCGAGGYEFIRTGNVLTVDRINYIKSNTNNYKIKGTSGRDYITSTGENVTIEGAGGNDTLVGSDEFGDIFLVSAREGSDVILNFGLNDTLKCTAGSIGTIGTDGDDYVIELKQSSNVERVRLKDTATRLTLRADDKVITAEALGNAQLPAYWFEAEASSDPLGELLDEAPLDNALALSETPLEHLKAQAMTLTQMEGKKQWQKSSMQQTN